MKKDNQARKIEEENESRKKLEFETCPCCGTGDLIEFGVDTICCHCDWAKGGGRGDGGGNAADDDDEARCVRGRKNCE